MAKILNKPTVAELLQAIREEDLGLTPRVSIKMIEVPKATTTIIGTEYIAMQMAMDQCNMYANLID